MALSFNFSSTKFLLVNSGTLVMIYSTKHYMKGREANGVITWFQLKGYKSVKDAGYTIWGMKSRPIPYLLWAFGA